jgi:hypothetical protein
MRPYDLVALVASLSAALALPTEPQQQPLGAANLNSFLKVQEECASHIHTTTAELTVVLID